MDWIAETIIIVWLTLQQIADGVEADIPLDRSPILGNRTSHPGASRPPLLIHAIFVRANFVQGHNRSRHFHPGS